LVDDQWRPSHEPGQDHGSDVDLVHDSLPRLSLQRVENFVAPTWLDGNVPKQMHLDFEVDDLDGGERHVLSAGARKTIGTATTNLMVERC